MRVRTLLSLAASLALIGACAPTVDTVAPPARDPSPAAASAAPAAQERPMPSADLVVGVPVARPGADADAALATLARALEAELDVTVALHAFDALPALRAALGDGTVHAGFLTPSVVVAALDAAQATPVMTVIRGRDVASRGEFYARCDAGYASIEDLRGARFAFVAPNSTLGHRAPYLTLVRAGIDPARDLEAVFAGSHDAVLQAIYGGDVDAGVTFAGGIELLLGTRADARDVICSLATTVDVPNDALVVGAAMDADASAALVAAFERALERPDASAALARLVGGDGRLERTAPERYDVMRDLAAALP